MGPGYAVTFMIVEEDVEEEEEDKDLGNVLSARDVQEVQCAMPSFTFIMRCLPAQPLRENAYSIFILYFGKITDSMSYFPALRTCGHRACRPRARVQDGDWKT